MAKKKTTTLVWVRLDHDTLASLDRLALVLRKDDPLTTRATAMRVAVARGLRSA